MRHRRIAYRRDVTVRQDEVVALGPRRVFGVVVEDMKIEEREDIGHAERTRGVTAPRILEHIDERDADVCGFELKFFDSVVSESHM